MEAQRTPPPRRTAAVTVAGVLLLPLAVLFAYRAATIATSTVLWREYAGTRGAEFAPLGFLLPVGRGLALAAIFGYAGFAMILRWRGWRIWAGTISWGLIAIMVFSLFALPSVNDRRLVSYLIAIAFAVFVLVAKRRERRPDMAAVFDP